MLLKIIYAVNNALYGYVLILLLVLGGIYFTVRIGFAQFRLLAQQFKSVTEKSRGRGASSFQMLMVSTASRVGTGNIIGVAAALCMGGFGSVFWMWVMAFVGAASAFVESTLAQLCKKRDGGGCYGGPACYIEAATGRRWLAVLFSVLLIVTYGIGFNMLASYNLQASFSVYGFYDARLTPWVIGLLLALTVGYCLLGGADRLAAVTSFLVPLMGGLYIAVALVITCINFRVLPAVLRRIFVEALDFKAIFGGFGGSCLMYGIRRGLFSNEAGVGSAPNASASAQVSHPVKQGLAQMLSVFIDTVLVCSATAFLCMTSGVPLPTSADGAAAYVQKAVAVTLGKGGPVLITAVMLLFGFTTLLGNLFYVEKALRYLLGREPGKRMRSACRVLASFVIFVGAGLSADLLWGIADLAMGAMTLINMPVIVYLGGYAVRALQDYEKQRKNGREITFRKKDIGFPYPTDYWN